LTQGLFPSSIAYARIRYHHVFPRESSVLMIGKRPHMVYIVLVNDSVKQGTIIGMTTQPWDRHRHGLQ
jgi:hypothetical protein